jgi:tRNA-splicing ligase RtcB
MGAAANYAFANRQVMAHWVRESIAEAMGVTPDQTGARTIYDVCHNIAKIEEFPDAGLAEGAAALPSGRGTNPAAGAKTRRLCVHRKGATRAYPAGHPQTPATYRHVGQPVLIPGDMGRYSYVLVGTERAFRETFGSSCHGAGRRWSRGHAKRQAKGQAVMKDMEARGVVVMAAGLATVAEEMPDAYKDVADVVRVVHEAGLARRVAQLRPIGVIKG